MAGLPSVRVRKSRRAVAGRGIVAACFAQGALSEPSAAQPEAPPNSREVWAGADVSTNVWLVYSGVTLAPWSGIHEDGVRFRSVGGYGEYQYSDKIPSLDPSFSRPVEYHAQTYFADLLVGYQQRFGELTAKAFVGASIISHDISPTDEETVAIGDETGVKGVLELWLNMGESAWGSLDLSWASAHNTRAARSRIGYRVWPKLSLGLEGGVNLDEQGECRMKAGTSGCKSTDDRNVDPAGLLDYARGGAFARYEWGSSEASISAGILGDSFASDGDIELAPYVTVNWLTQF